MRRVLLVLAAVAIIAAGCAEEVPIKKTLPPKATSLHKSVFINDIRLEVATIKDVFPSDEIVPIRISMTNTGDKKQVMTFPTAQKQDFSAANVNGVEVWRWSAGQVFAQSVTEMTAEPGATYNYFGKINAGVLKPGRYKVSGWLLAQELLEEKITLVITIK
jgi:hypothetical protein